MRKLGRSTKFFHFSKRELRNLSFFLSVERVFANFLDGQLISARGRRGRYRRTWMEEGEKGQARNARVPHVVVDVRAPRRRSLGRESVDERSPIPIPAS